MATYSNLSIGSSGDAVKKLQNALINAGYSVGSTGADGKYGANTQAAVKQYQKDNGLTVDGIAGNLTLGSLFGGTSQSSGSTGATSGSSLASYRKASGRPQQVSAPTYSYDTAGDAAYQEALAALQAAQKNAPTYANSYEGQLKDLYDQIVNRDKFRYDINEDVLYQQYAEQYANKGRMAMMDTMGQAAALTGGYASTYGQAVGQQQYDAYLQQLNDAVPELYQMAYQQYRDEGDKLTQQYTMLGDLADDEYLKYQDAYNQWLTERSYAQDVADTAYNRGYDQWLQQINQYNEDRNYQLALEQFAWQKQQAAAAAAAKSSGGSSSGSSKGSGNQQNTEKYTASTAMRLAAASSSSTQGQIMALDAMYENGNITKQEHTNLVYALKNPGR